MNPFSFYFLVLVEVVFQTAEGVSVLKRQIFEKSDIDTFPARRIHQLNNVAALQLKQTLPPVLQESFQALDAYILNILPLGQFTEEEFWKGMAPPSSDGGQEAPVAAGETPVTDTAANDTSNVHPIRPGVAQAPAAETAPDSVQDVPQDEPIAPSEVGPDPVDQGPQTGLEGLDSHSVPAPQNDPINP